MKIPDTTLLLEILVRLHDDVRQIKYPYSAKVLKWGIISESEIEEAQKRDADASERTVWEGHRPVDVAHRLAGAVTNLVDQEGIREKWIEKGMADGSWKAFVAMFCNQKAAAEPFNSPDYLRFDELDNFLALVKIMDEEIASSPLNASTSLPTSFKSKWWTECNRVFSEAVREEVYRGLNLRERPKEGICYTKTWPPKLQTEIRKIAKRWALCPIWEQAQSTSMNEGVDFTSNNASTVKKYLSTYGFVTSYLEGRHS